MKAIVLTFVLLGLKTAYAESTVPSGIKCVRESERLGLTPKRAYEICSMNETFRSCIFNRLRENQGLSTDMRNLIKMGKHSMNDCKKLNSMGKL